VIGADHAIHLIDVSICSYNHWVEVESSSNISTVLYGDIELEGQEHDEPANLSFNSYAERINEVWFKYFGAIKKFARKDHLIGLHLVLDLIREYLVVEMIERDIQHQTTIHRHGYGENLPKQITLSQLDETDIYSVLEYLKRLAFEYDRKLLMHVKGYESRYLSITKYIEESKSHLQ
jgi:hypothetical protein